MPRASCRALRPYQASAWAFTPGLICAEQRQPAAFFPWSLRVVGQGLSLDLSPPPRSLCFLP